MSAVISSLAQMTPQFGNFVMANPDRYAVLGLILLSPLLGAIINGLFGKRIGREGVYITAVSTVAMSFLLSLLAYFTLSVRCTRPFPRATRTGRCSSVMLCGTGFAHRWARAWCSSSCATCSMSSRV